MHNLGTSSAALGVFMNKLRTMLCIVCLASCVQAQAGTTVFAASSLTDVLEEIIAAYEQETGKEVSASYAASSVLAKQIEAGSPAHIFISADEDWMDYLGRHGYVSVEPRVLAGNRLVLIAPAESTVSVSIGTKMNLAGILKNERMAVADPASVPAGSYARAALEFYGEWPALRDRLIPLDNVRAALVVVQRKEAPLGIVYETDAVISPQVRVVGVFPAESHAPIVYPAALVTENRNTDANALFDYLQSPAAKAVFAKHGFQIIAGTDR